MSAQVSRSSYLTFPVRKSQPVPHDDECACDVCVAEFAARRAAAVLHKKYIECAICGERLRVNGHAVSMTKRRKNTIRRHIEERHA